MNSVRSEAPRLTIAIPTLNRSALVARAVESAIAQTFPSIEIIVSNNGSTDDTREVLERYASDPRLRIFHRETTIPATEHGTWLVDQARGEFFVGLSDDDWLEPEFAVRVMALYDHHPDISFAWTGCFIHYADSVMPAKIGPEVESGREFLAAFLRGDRNVCWCACVTRTADLRRIGPIPPDVICGDMFYWTKLAAAGNVGCVSDTLSHYVAYRDAGTSSASGTPILTWARDADRWVRDIITVCGNGGGPNMARLAHDGAVFLSRTTANQFIWQALRGEKRLSLLGTVPRAFRYLVGPDPRPWIRVMASIVAPRWLLRSSMMAAARWRARRANLASGTVAHE
ncbi:MAG: glycosyltransferase family 2 protein [Thermoanaerobaculia bacterium]